MPVAPCKQLIPGDLRSHKQNSCYLHPAELGIIPAMRRTVRRLNSTLGGARGRLFAQNRTYRIFLRRFQKDGATEWDGVRNPVALRNLREMKPGDRPIIYETGDRKSAVGTASVVSVQVSNPKNPVVKIKAGKPVAKPVPLSEIKANKLFATSPPTSESAVYPSSR